MMMAGSTYTAVLFSSAPDAQSKAYFIKGGSDLPLFLVDENGDPYDDPLQPPVDLQSIPEPLTGSAAVMGLVALAGCMRRRRSAPRA